MVSIPSTNDRVSRWTPSIFACAFVNFVLAQLLLVTGVSWATAPDRSGATLAAVHLLTIGWITLLMFGALFQFVPVLTSRTLWSQKLSLGALLFIELGLIGMVGGFFLLSTPWGLLLPAGGSAVIGPVIASGVEYHMLAGIGGWFTLTAVGVSYELLPMFMLAPHNRGAWGRGILWTATAGFVAALGAGLIAPCFPGIIVSSVEQAGRAAIAIAAVLYLIDIGRMYRGRRRRQIELHNRAAVAAFASLGIALAIAVAGAALNELDRVAPTIMFLLIFGWLSGLGLSQLYKIVPFLAWLSRFGRRLGTGPVPRVQDLVDERAATHMFAAYFVSVAAAAVAAFLDAPWLVRGAMIVTLGTTMLLGREYWRAWQGYYAQRSAPARIPVPNSPGTKRAGHEHTRATHA